LYTRPTKNSKSWQVPRKPAPAALTSTAPAAAAPGTASLKGGGAVRSSRGPPTAKSDPSLTHRADSPVAGHGTSHGHGHSGAAEKVDEDFPDKQRNKFKIPGLPEPTAATQRRARNREHTLDRIDQVGDNNSNILYV
jgi:hypothetical protein